MGPVSIKIGSTPTRQVSTIRARGVSPSSLAFSGVIRRTAPAPSEIWEALPAVCTPSSPNTGLRPERLSAVVSRRPSSRATWCVVPDGLPSSPRSGASTGMICVAKRSSAHARAPRSCDDKPSASVSSRVMFHFLAMRSAPSNCEVYSYCGKYDFGMGEPMSRPLATFEPIGTLLITSTPPATALSMTPAAMSA